MKAFIHDDFLLQTDAAKDLYHNFAKNEPIYDYHCHLPHKQILENKSFADLSEIWLGGDHYKWRAMRSNGVDERFCTGNATPREKFDAWCGTVPHTLRNPLYHWSHLELARYFGITDIINLTKDRYVLFAGVDDLFLECMMLGAVGWVSGLVNAFPHENKMIWDLASAGKWKEALEVYRWYTPLLHLDTHVKLVQYIKLASAECGYGTELCRPPRLPLVGAEREHVLKLIRTAIATRPKR